MKAFALISLFGLSVVSISHAEYEDPCLVMKAIYQNKGDKTVEYFHCQKMNFDSVYVQKSAYTDTNVCLTVSQRGDFVGLYGSFFWPKADGGMDSKGKWKASDGMMWTKLRMENQFLQGFSNAKGGERFLGHYGIVKSHFDLPETKKDCGHRSGESFELNPVDGATKNSKFTWDPILHYLEIEQTAEIYHSHGMDFFGYTSGKNYKNRVHLLLQHGRLSLSTTGPDTINTGVFDKMNCVQETEDEIE